VHSRGHLHGTRDHVHRAGGPALLRGRLLAAVGLLRRWLHHRVHPGGVPLPVPPEVPRLRPHRREREGLKSFFHRRAVMKTRLATLTLAASLLSLPALAADGKVTFKDPSGDDNGP